MADPLRRYHATYDDVVDAPEHVVAELIDGELLMSPRPTPPHARVSSALGGELNFRFDGPGRGSDRPGGWWILDEPELHLGTHLGRGDARDVVLVPHLAGWRRERLPVLPEEVGFLEVPDWVCEVLSPSTARVDRLRKLPLYAAVGVAHVWLVDPLQRTVEVHRPVEGLPTQAATYLAEEDADPLVHLPPFGDIGLDSTRWW